MDNLDCSYCFDCIAEGFVRHSALARSPVEEAVGTESCTETHMGWDRTVGVDAEALEAVAVLGWLYANCDRSSLAERDSSRTWALARRHCNCDYPYKTVDFHLDLVKSRGFL